MISTYDTIFIKNIEKFECTELNLKSRVVKNSKCEYLLWKRLWKFILFYGDFNIIFLSF